MFAGGMAKNGFTVAWLLLMVSSVAFGGVETFPISRAADDQEFPAVDDCTVVWQDHRNGDWDISVANISDPCAIVVLTLADEFGEGQYPAVSGNIVVWQSKLYLYEDWDILGIDLTTQTVFEVLATFADERRPAISGHMVVAETKSSANSTWDAIGIDISNREVPQRFWVEAGSGDEGHADIYGNIVVYQDSYEGIPFVSGRDISDPCRPVWLPIYGRGDTQQTPAVYGNWVVWLDEVQGAAVVAGDNIFHPSQAVNFESGDPNASEDPDICNNLTVWQDSRNGNWDIYGYNLTTKQTFAITSDPADQMHPAVSFSPRLNAYVVVWQDFRNGNWDIYGALLDGPEVAGCASPLRTDVNADGVVDANDLDEVQADLGRKNGIPIESD